MPATTHDREPAATRVAGPPAAPDRQTSIEQLLSATKRQIVPIRRSFVQLGHGPTTRPGPLSAFLRAHDDRGLEAYLFAHAMASSADPYDCVLPAGAWVRVLGIGGHADGSIDPRDPSARSAVSKVLKRLEDRHLITRGRRNRKAVVTLLREDGRDEPYERPQGRTRGDRWLRLPHAYWTDQHYRTLSMPAKTVLLIALSRPAGFSLPEHKGPDWYGASPDSIGDGLRELINSGLLYRDYEWVSAPRSANGWTQRHLYTLRGAFSAVELDKAARSRDAKPDTDTDTDTVAGEVASEVPVGDQVIDLTAYRRSS